MREMVLRAKQFISDLVKELRMTINQEKSLLGPSQSFTYLRMEIDTIRSWFSPARNRIGKAIEVFREFWSSNLLPARSWLQLLGHMSSLGKLVPGARLCMRKSQFFPKRVWNRGLHPKDNFF